MSSLEGLFPDATQEANDALSFYDKNYCSIGQWILEPKNKVILRSSQPGLCRFCGLRAPDVTFQMEAHAIAESMGNKSLTTKYECDDCNQFFGGSIENDFGNWSKPMRTMAHVRGKNGVPTLKKGSNGGWRVEHGPAGLEVTQYEDDPIAVVNETTKDVILTLRRDPYTPVAVMKAFTKIALSLVPESELPNFQKAIAWIRDDDHEVGLVKSFPILHTFVPGNDPFVNTSVILLRRKIDDLLVPYVTYVLTYGNEMFQTVLPSLERDAAINRRKGKFPYFPIPYELDRSIKLEAPIRRELIDLTGRSLVKGDTIQMVISGVRRVSA